MADPAILRLGVYDWQVRRRLMTEDETRLSAPPALAEVPLNAEDMVATLLAFSYNVLLGVERLGGWMAPREREDFLHAWAWIGHVLGIPEALNPCVAEASASGAALPRAEATLESIAMHLLDPDEGSIEVAHHLLHAMAGAPPFVGWSFARHCAASRLLMGPSLADRLRLPRTSFGDALLLRAAVLAPCRAACALASAARHDAPLRLVALAPLARRLCALHRRVLAAAAALAHRPEQKR